MPEPFAILGGGPLVARAERDVSLRVLTVRVLVVGAIATLTLLWLQEALLVATLPAMEILIELLRTDIDVSLSWSSRSTGSLVRMEALTARTIDLGSQWVVPRGTNLGTFTTSAHHTLVPLLLFLTTLLAWPAERFREWPRRMLWAGPVLVILLAVGAPLVLLGQVEIAVFRMARRIGASLEPSLLTQWMVFMEMGGAWLLPLASAAICVLASKRRGTTSRPPDTQPHDRISESVPIVFAPVAVPAVDRGDTASR